MCCFYAPCHVQIVNGQFLDGVFVTTIYKLLLGMPVSLEDMAQVRLLL
jgi:hypothetical protein